MPYIDPKRREKFNNLIEELGLYKLTVGEINYIITKFIHEVILGNKLCYDMLNSLIGVLECAKLELYRMVAAPYENKKRMENGPISSLDAKSLEDVR